MIDSIAIMNVKQREAEGEALKAIVMESVAFAGLETPVEIFLDDGSFGTWKNFKRTLLTDMTKKDRYRLVIHDDITFGRTAIMKMNHILTHAPSGQIHPFYCPTNRGYTDAYERGQRIVKTSTNVWLQATVYPLEKMKEAITWLDSTIKESYPWEDRRMCYWVKNQPDLFFYSHVPSFVQHLGAFRSTQGVGGKVGRYERVSTIYKPDAPVFDVDWHYHFQYPGKSETNIKIPDEYFKA